MLLIILFITFYFDLDNLKYERDQLRMDNFIIQLMLSIQDNNDTFIKKNTNFDPSQFSWQHEISNDFYILRDTILGGVVYYIYFNNDIVLNINVGKKLTEYYGAATFEILDIYEEKSIEAKENNLTETPFYFLGKYKIYMN